MLNREGEFATPDSLSKLRACYRDVRYTLDSQGTQGEESPFYKGARPAEEELSLNQEQVIPDWAEATTMSVLGPLTCSALTVIDPVIPLGELVCSLTMRLMPPGNEMARFGLDVSTDWPAATKPTSSAFPVTAACPLAS